jgi:hypothetical protein
MPSTFNILFSQPPHGVSDAEFTEWYEAHIQEILEVPRFKAAQVFRLDPEVGSVDGPVPFGYAVVYEVDGTFAEGLAEQQKAGVATYEQYVEFKKTDTKGPPIPEWLTATSFGWWNGVAATKRYEEAGG